MATPGNNSEQFKSFLYLLSGIFFVLVLLDKGISKKNISDVDLQKPKGFKNIGKDFLEKIETTKPEKSKSNEENNLESVVASDDNDITEDSSIPILEEPSEQLASKNTETLYVYFLKFYGKGNKSHSRLARVAREAGGTNRENIQIILNELIKGPTPEEKEKGILNAIPPRLIFSKDPKIKDGILHVNLNEQFEYGAGPEIIKDRLDQLTHSLLQIPDVRGLSITINNRKINSLGGDGVPLPSVLVKNHRKVMFF